MPTETANPRTWQDAYDSILAVDRDVRGVQAELATEPLAHIGYPNAAEMVAQAQDMLQHAVNALLAAASAGNGKEATGL